MSKAFPTKEELAKTYIQWAIGLTVGGTILWGITYACCMTFVYGSMCPIILGSAVWTSFKAVRYRSSIGRYFLLLVAVICFLISLLPWGLPIAR